MNHPTGIDPEVIERIFAMLTAAELDDKELDAFLCIGAACLSFDIRRGMCPKHLMVMILETVNRAIAEITPPLNSSTH